MPKCSICGEPIAKLPDWLDDVEITYRCAVCAESVSHSILRDLDDSDDAEGHDDGEHAEDLDDEPEDEEEEKDE